MLYIHVPRSSHSVVESMLQYHLRGGSSLGVDAVLKALGQAY